MVRIAVIVVCLAVTVAPRLVTAEDPRPLVEDWLAEYKKLGGKAGVNTSTGPHPTLWVQKRFGQMPLVGLKGMKTPPGIRAVSLQGYEVEDDDLLGLATWPGLEEVSIIDGKKVGDKGVQAIAKLPKLHRLDLVDTVVSEVGLAQLSGHRALTQLDLSNTVVTTKVRALRLKDIPKLESLSLACEGGMTSVSLTALPQLKQLGDFPLDVETAEVSGLPKLTDLDFRGSKLRKLTIADMPGLESIDLRDTQVDDETVKELKKKFPKVEVRR